MSYVFEGTLRFPNSRGGFVLNLTQEDLVLGPGHTTHYGIAVTSSILS